MLRLLAVALAALVLAGGAAAAAPNYVVVSGPGLASPVVLGNWRENLTLLLAVANAPRAHAASLGRRPRLRLSEFWGWRGRPRPTGPAGANQRGWFYPAAGGRPAVIVLTAGGRSFPRLAPRRVLAILARHGVPTRA